MEWEHRIDDIRIELGLLHQLRDEADDLIRAVKNRTASTTQRLAAGCVLQSFYNDIERILQVIASEHEEDYSSAENPRRGLLEGVSQPSEKRIAVIDAHLLESLRRYFRFREAFRYGQYYQLKWTDIAPLVVDLPKTLGGLETQLQNFFEQQIGELKQPLAEDPSKMPRYWTEPYRPEDTGVPRRLVTAICAFVLLLGVAIGIFSTRMVLRKIGGPAVNTLRANVLEPVRKQLRFFGPSGEEKQIPVPDSRKPYYVVTGELVEDSDDPFTGQVVQKSDRDISEMSATFQNGNPVFIQSADESDKLHLGMLSGETLLRYLQCAPDGMPQEEFHTATDGQAYLRIYRGRYRDASTRSVHDGWYYRFYHKASPATRLFVSDEGAILHAETPTDNAQ